jgi:hypothetical protein
VLDAHITRRPTTRNATMSVYEKTFTLKDEDHTIGNAVRYMLNKNPQVSLAGYSVPHPMETSVNVRVQTTVGLGREGGLGGKREVAGSSPGAGADSSFLTFPSDTREPQREHGVW